jgi:signal transduction histidine kinase
LDRLVGMVGSPAAWRLGNADIKTKLLLMMLSLLILSVSALFVLHLLNERQLLAQVRDYTDELSTTIEIAQEQPAGPGDPQIVLKAYAEKLTALGVKDVSIADAAEEVQASTNPQNVGKPLVRTSTHRRGPKEYVIRGVLGDDSGPPGTQKTSTLTIPIVVADRRVGYVLITRYLDDFSALSNDALVNRLIATFGVFAVGIALALYLSWSFSRPLEELTNAARSVAAGDLAVTVAARGNDEIGALSRTFNEMVERLREKRVIEERLHFAERSTAMGRLASAVAHEIRNPLNFMNLSIDHIREKLAPEDPERRAAFLRLLGNVKAEISRLNRLVGNFLSFGKPMRLDRRPCRVDAVLREVAELVDHKARDQGVALELHTGADFPETPADAELLKTCFLNLMINALDAMPKGGVLTVTATPTREAGGDILLVTVTDTGQGMGPAEIRTAFEPYFSTKETGLGLGLALTRKIVSDHGGTIALESSPGVGTRARIVLPLVPRSVSEPAAEALIS